MFGTVVTAVASGLPRWDFPNKRTCAKELGDTSDDISKLLASTPIQNGCCAIGVPVPSVNYRSKVHSVGGFTGKSCIDERHRSLRNALKCFNKLDRTGAQLIEATGARVVGVYVVCEGEHYIGRRV